MSEIREASKQIGGSSGRKLWLGGREVPLGLRSCGMTEAYRIAMVAVVAVVAHILAQAQQPLPTGSYLR